MRPREASPGKACRRSSGDGGVGDEINLAYTALPAKIKIWIFIQLAMRSHWKLLGRKWHFQSAFIKRMMAAMERRV